MPPTTSKYSFSVPVSAPATPAPSARATNKHERHGLSPVTPQRIANRSVRNTPITPASTISTPYSPISLRSRASSDASLLATPHSAVGGRRRGLSLSMSPLIQTNLKRKNSIADVTDNWRCRAKENGIRVTASQDSNFADDEDSERTMSDATPDNSMHDQVSLPPAFSSTHRRARAFTQSHVPAQTSMPQIPSTPSRRALADLNTPSPKASNVNMFRLKGSLTDPASTRRRPAFDQFTAQLFDIEEDEYVPYPPNFGAVAPNLSLPLNLQDPFHYRSLSPITESNALYSEVRGLSQMRPISEEPIIDASSCTVCGRSVSSAVLVPCQHPICSGCLTSALNIVGEKDMACAVCTAPVADFKLQVPSFSPGNSVASPSPRLADKFGEPGLLPSAFDIDVGGAGSGNGSPYSFFDRAQGSSTPLMEAQSLTATKTGDCPVLRIDNVPWDITPPRIVHWVKHPIRRAHVLLDPKGKTLSHAFVEMASEDAARLALRSCQNSVLGSGKRARGVTVTMSSQEELMRCLFTNWRGNWDGVKPSLKGLATSEEVRRAFEAGLVGVAQLESLLSLIKDPASHFLKVPELPYYLLISILSKLPADGDSRVFWQATLRDMLYDVTFAAVQVLLSRIQDNETRQDTELLSDLIEVALECQAFTHQQHDQFADVVDNVPAVALSLPALTKYTTPDFSQVPSPRLPESVLEDCDFEQNDEAGYDQLDAIAKEFGIDTQLVEALARRFSTM